jgi:aspartate carbamoyltransferase catalytic subunit
MSDVISAPPPARHQGAFGARTSTICWIRPTKRCKISRQREKKTTTLRGLTQINLFLRKLDPDAGLVRTGRQAAWRRRDEHVGGQFERQEGRNAGRHRDDAQRHAPDVLVVRHSSAGAVALLSQKVGCPVINAGDGAHEHPTQALLDALTIRRAKGKVGRLIVAICGDVLHSRVARSNILLLNALGARVRVVAPSTLLPSGIADMGVEVFQRMEDGLKDADVVMMLRLQRERMAGSFVPSVREYFRYYGLDADKLARQRKMHW